MGYHEIPWQKPELGKAQREVLNAARIRGLGQMPAKCRIYLTTTGEILVLYSGGTWEVKEIEAGESGVQLGCTTIDWAAFDEIVKRAEMSRKNKQATVERVVDVAVKQEE